MDRNLSVTVLALLVLCTGLLGACSDDTSSDHAGDIDRPLGRVAAPPPSTAPTSTDAGSSTAAGASSPSSDALAVAADAFAAALLAHDLTGLTTSFSPGGLAQAQALTAGTGSQRAEGVTAARVASMRDLDVPEGRWEVYLDVTGQRGDVQLRTIWQWYEVSGWRIAAIEIVLPGAPPSGSASPGAPAGASG